MGDILDYANPLESVEGITDSVMTGLDELFTSDDERNKARILLVQELNKTALIQAQINMQEAKHPSIFVAGWRPALGWMCVLLLGYAWIGRSMLIFLLTIWGPDNAKDLIDSIPEAETGELMSLTLAMLGLGATRAYEKVNGVARNSWSFFNKRNK